MHTCTHKRGCSILTAFGVTQILLLDSDNNGSWRSALGTPLPLTQTYTRRKCAMHKRACTDAGRVAGAIVCILCLVATVGFGVWRNKQAQPTAASLMHVVAHAHTQSSTSVHALCGVGAVGCSRCC